MVMEIPIGEFRLKKKRGEVQIGFASVQTLSKYNIC